MKSIRAIKDLDDADCVIKWRITDLCNIKCSYCLRKYKQTRKATDELIKEQTEKLCSVIEQISKMLEKTEFKNVKIDLIGGEVSLFDLKRVFKHLKSDKVKKSNITTNFIKSADYYADLCDFFHEIGIKNTVTASFHYEFQTLENYLKKIEAVRNKFDILKCEMVSTSNNQELCRTFIKECESRGLDYMVEADLSDNKLNARKNGLITASRKKKNRYLVEFTDGGKKEYSTRNQLLTDAEIKENFAQKAINTYGLICTNGFDYIYIDFDTVISRTKENNNCTTKTPVEKYEFTEPKECKQNICTLCGHCSIHRKYK